MQSKITRISRRAISVVLTVLMMVSVLGIGSLITANAADVSKKATGSGWTTNSLNFRGKINTNKFGATTGGDNDNWNSIAMVSGGNNNNYYYMNAIVEGNKKVTFKFTDQWTQWLGGGTRTAGTYTGGSYVYYTGMSTSGGNDYFTTPSAADYYVCAIQCWTNYSNDWKCRIDMFPLSSTKLHFYKASGYNKVYSFSTTTKGANSPTATSVSSTNTLTDTVHFNNLWNSETAGSSETLSVSDFGTTYNKSWYCLDKFYYGSLASKLTTNTAIIHSSSAQGVEKTLNISDLDLGELWVYDNGTNFVVSDRSALRDEFDSATRDYSTAYNGGTNPGFTSTTYSAFKTAYQNAASTYTAYASTTANCDDAISDLQDAYDDLAVDVTWKNGSETIYTDTCTIGNTPSYDSATHGTPAKASTAQYSYTFTGWSPSPAAVTASGGAQTMSAQFSSTTRKYNVKKSESGTTGGTVTLGGTTLTTSNKSFNYGTNYTLSITAPTGYNVTAVSGISGTIASGGLNTGAISYSGVSITAATTISVTYALKTYTVKKSENVTGTVQVDSTAISTSGVSITHGTHTVSITAPTGYNVTAVSGISGTVSSGGLNTGAISYSSVSITAATTISVTYTQKTYAITFSETGGSGTFQADGEAFTSGSTVTHGSHSFTINAPSGFNVSAVTGFGEGSWTGIGTGTASLASTAVTSAKTVNVTYVSATTPGVTVEADFDNSSNKANIGSTVTITATKTHPTGSAGAMTYSVKLDDVAATVNTDYTISSSTAGNVTTYTIVPLKAGVFKVTAGYTDTGNPSATATFGVNTPTITVANNSTIKIGQSYTISPTITNTSGSDWEVVYSRTSGSAATLSDDSIKAVTTGTAGFSVSLQYNGVQKAATTFSVTPVVPTVAFGTTTAASINVGGTVTRAATKGSSEVGTVTSDTITYSRTPTTYTSITTSSGKITGKKPGGPTTVSATRTIECDGVTTTINSSNSYTVTVTAPTLTFNAASTNIGGTIDLSAQTSSTGATTTPTYTYTITSRTDADDASIIDSTLNAGETSGTVTVQVSARYNSSYTVTASQTFTVNTPGISAFSYSTNQIYIDGNTSNPSVTTTNPSSVSSPWSVTYSITGGSDYATINTTTGVVTGVYTGSATNRTVTVTASLNYNGTSKATRTATVTVKPPTVSFTSSSAVALNVGATNTNTASGSNPTGGTVTYSGTNQYINVNASTGQVTALKPTSSAQTVTASYAVTRNSKTTTVSTTYNVTVGTPTITFNGPTTLAVGDKAATTVSATNVTSPSYTYDVKTGSSYASVDSNGKVTGLAAGTATIRVTATKESWTDTAEITVNVQAPSMTIADVESDGSTVLYTTVGTNITKAISANFNGTYSYSYSKSGVATASVSNGTLTITPQAKGSTTITVTDTKAAAQIASAKRGISKGKLATGAAGDIEVSQTFTVNVAEADTYKYLYFENGVNWSGINAYFYGDGSNASFPGEPMVKIGTNTLGKDIYAIRYPSTKNYTNVIISKSGDDSKRVKVNNTTDILMTSSNTIWSDSVDSNGGWYNSTVVKPQITVNDIADLAVDDDATLTATVVNQATPSKYKWESADSTTATVASGDTNTTNTNTVTGVNAGSTTVTVTAYCAMPVFNGTALTSIVTNGTADDYVAGTATATVAVVDTPRTINFSNTLRTSTGGTYDQPNANLAGSISASYTAGSSGSGSGSGSGGGGTASSYYVHYNKTGSDSPSNYSTHVNMIEYNGKLYATIDNASTNTNVYFNINTNSSNSTPNSYVLYGNGYTPTTQGGVTALGIQNYGSNDKCYVWANQSNYTTLYVILDTTNKNLTVTTTDPGVSLDDGSGSGSGSGDSGSSTPVVSGGSVPNNSDVTFTVDSVTAGYRFVGWEDNGTVVSTETSYTKTGVRSDYTVHARFEKGVEVTFKALNDNNQLITVLGPTFTFDGEVPATPANDPTHTGDTFTGWSSDGGSTTYTTANIPAVSGTSAIVYVAQYTPVIYSVTGSVKISNNGTDYSAGTNVEGHQISITNTDGSAIADPSHMTHPATVKIVATAGADYQLVGIYRVHSDSTEETVECVTAADGKTMTCNSYSLTTENEPAYNFVAKFKKIHYITLYNTYEEEAGNKFKFVSPPPRQVKVGTGGSAITYTYAAGTAGQRGEDHYATLNAGSTTQGTYYEGNRIPVVAGTEVKLTYSALASSDAISGVFYNNSIRYTHEYEDDNLYKNRVEYTGASEDCWGNEGDDNFGTSINPYTYLSATTLFADASFYSGATASTISGQTYTATVNNTDHTVTWTAVDDYLNVDLELASKYRIIINNDEWNGIEVTNSTYNAEGYYYPGETINGSTGIEVSLDTSDSTKHFSFTDVNTIQKKTGDNTYETVTDVELVKSNGKYYIRGTDENNKDMPAYDIYVDIGIREEYKMYLDNFVVADKIGSRKALTETYSKTDSSAPYGDRIGTITAVTSDDVHIETDCPDSAYSYAQISANPSQNTHWVQNGSNWNPKYKGTNTTGASVEAGQTVTYTFTFNTYDSTDYANYYSFIGWFEGTISNGDITPDYTKKLSGKTTFTYTPKKDTVIVAAGTRDMYLGGNFTNGGAYTTTAGQQTWSTNRIQMEFDPTYVKPGESDKKGRYFYKFDTVTANTEYQFRCYDTVSGSDSADLSVWQTWSGADYADDNDDIFYGRHKYDNSTNSHGQFVYKNNTNNWSLIDNKASDHDSTKNHQALGYAAPVTVYFYAYDGGIGVEAEYQWSKAYVSAGRGIDCTNYSSVINSGATPSYNTPTVSVANKTVGNKDVDGTTTPVSYGDESVYRCTVKEKDGQIVVSACPGTTDLELDAFVVYNIDTKESEAVKHSSTTGTGDATNYVANITVPQNSSVYVVPVYKFTDAYVRANSLKAHTVYVRTDDIDKDVWGGLVAMFSWGSKTDSGGWPGQLLIPSDDGNSFYGQLAFGAGDLRGITFNNYCRIFGGAQKTFLGTYGSDVSTRAYSGNSTHVYQTYDYREPISIIENIDDKIYEDEDMDLTFALKSGNMTAAPTINSAGSGAYARASSFEYLTDRSGKKRVDLNGNVLATNSTETYRIVAYYTNAYASSGSYDFRDGSRNGTGYSGSYSINWTVYDATGASTGVSGVLSAAYVDTLKSEGLTYIASKLIEAGLPVSGKAVKIAYENPGVWSETIRYSGQWYADGVNTLIEAKTRVGIYSDGAWLPSDTNAPGYGTATIACPTMNAGKGENLVSEFSSGNSLAKVIKSRGTNGEVQFTVDTTDNFLGWYREDGEGGYVPVGSNYKNQTITPSFNDDITYYAFYSASASYRFAYTSRDGSTKYYTAKGTDLTDAELANNGTLNPTVRATDITSKLGGISGIKVFNNTLTYALGTPTLTPYTITYTAAQTENTYEVNVYNGSKAKIGTVTSTFGGKPVDLYKEALTGKPAYSNIGLGSGDNVFIGWKKYNGTSAVGDYLSTQPNFGYNVTEDMDIIACYGTESEKETARADSWKSYIDKNVITQELTSETTGMIYNDNIIAFRNGVGTSTPLPLDGTKECGIVILAQTNGATDAQKTAFNTRGKDNLAKYANNFRTTGSTSGKMNSTYGEAYAFCVKVNSLSELNRIDLCQILDYAKFSGGQFKVMSYYYDGSSTKYDNLSVNGYKCSEVISKTYTAG